ASFEEIVEAGELQHALCDARRVDDHQPVAMALEACTCVGEQFESATIHERQVRKVDHDLAVRGLEHLSQQRRRPEIHPPPPPYKSPTLVVFNDERQLRLIGHRSPPCATSPMALS